MKNGYIIDHRALVDIQEVIKIVGKVIEIYEGVFYRKNLNISPFREVMVNLVASRQKYRKENNDVMELLIKLLMNSLYGERIRKTFEEEITCNQNFG